MSAMKEIRTVDAVGQVLCHDITQIVRGVTKNARFRKGHVIQEEDVPVLLSLGKDHIYVWDEDATEMHENEAADVLRELCQNEHMTATAPKEGKIELIADCDGVFQVAEDRFDAVNELEDVTIATLAQNMPVKKGANPIKANGRAICIDGGFAKPYQKTTGIAGYSLIQNSYGFILTAHEAFESKAKAVQQELDIHSTQVAREDISIRMLNKDTDQGAEIQEKIDGLKMLLEAYHTGLIPQTVKQ